ncbi:hypothetical protein [Paracoccus sp. (in: a-proteobacteria)]|uniref:hypothetical protein n=1 Tax=Paracoccus sp. TaxID=267 RepID=UPI00289E802C|nr:hypothetical protein [Paracoccus sp. (in: a-proteobacteria)]
MGFSPAQVGEMTPWQFMACLDGYGRANGWQSGPKGNPMSESRLKELGIEGF